MSVPTLTLKVVQRRRVRVFWILGLVLCVLIIFVGILNDQNQYQAEVRADATQQQGAELGRKFSDFIDKYPNGAPSLNSSRANADQIKTYDHELNELRAIAQSLSSMSHSLSPTNHTVSTPSVSAQAPPISQPMPSQTQALVNVVGQLESLASELDTIDEGLQQEGYQLKPYFIYPESNPDPVGLSKEMRTEIEQSNQLYSTGQYPAKILFIRKEVHRLFDMSSKQIADDNAKFKSLNSAALAPTPTAGLGTQELFGLMFQHKFAEMSQYLRSLKTPPATSK